MADEDSTEQIESLEMVLALVWVDVQTCGWCVYMTLIASFYTQHTTVRQVCCPWRQGEPYRAGVFQEQAAEGKEEAVWQQVAGTALISEAEQAAQETTSTDSELD